MSQHKFRFDCSFCDTEHVTANLKGDIGVWACQEDGDLNPVRFVEAVVHAYLGAGRGLGATVSPYWGNCIGLDAYALALVNARGIPLGYADDELRVVRAVAVATRAYLSVLRHPLAFLGLWVDTDEGQKALFIEPGVLIPCWEAVVNYGVQWCQEFAYDLRLPEPRLMVLPAGNTDGLNRPVVLPALALERLSDWDLTLGSVGNVV